MAKATNPMLETLINCRVYNNNNDLIGVANVDLPDIQPMTSTVSGIGIAGEVEAPVLGHYQSMSVTLHWKGLDRNLGALGAFQAHALEIRGEQQAYDAGTGEFKPVPVRIVLRGMPKSMNLGSFEAGSNTEAETEFEVVYFKMYIDGKEVCEIDKYNFIARFGGTDYLKQVRADLGLN